MNDIYKSDQNVEISIKDLEALMLASSVVRGVYSAVDSHRQDAAVNRTKDNVSQAISNAGKQISNARRIKDPMEDEPPTADELKIMETFKITYEYDPVPLDPTSPEAVSMLRKRLVVMGHMVGTIHWGDKTTEVRSDDRVVWKLTQKGADAV